MLRAVFFGGSISRPELQRMTWLSSASISNVVTDLMNDNLIVEAGQTPADGGRPAALLQINPGFGYFVGAEAGETRINVELFDFAMQKVAARSTVLASGHHEPELVADHIAAGYRDVIAAAGIDESAVVGLGVGVPGVVDQENVEHRVDAPGFGWRSVPFGAMLADRIDTGIYLDNGARTLGQAEMWFGAGRGADHAVVVLLGTGVGAAIFADGQMYRGSTTSAGEWGHVNVALDGRACRCGAAGCLEAYVGSWAIIERWGKVSSIAGTTSNDEEAAIERLLVHQARSKTAKRVVAETATYLGTAVAGLINLLNPERIVIGGWAGLLLGDYLLPTVKDIVARQALPFPASSVDVRLGHLGSDATALGAATLAVESLLARGGESPPAATPSRSNSVIGVRR